MTAYRTFFHKLLYFFCISNSLTLKFEFISRISLKQYALFDSPPIYGGLHHAGILVSDTLKSKTFYIDVFGFSDESYLRPASLPYPGAFLRCGSDQIHLMELPSNDPKEGRPAHGGRDRHVALTINDISVLEKRLEARKISFTLSQSGRRALFCRDPDGNAFEFMEDTSLNE